MNIADIFMRALDNNGDVYAPYNFEGEWTEAEKEVVSAAIDPHVPGKVDAMFNNWLFTKSNLPNFFILKRATWDQVICVTSAADVAVKIASYYARKA